MAKNKVAGQEIETSLPRSADLALDIAVLFLRLGTTAFGGPAAHIAMMDDEVVRRDSDHAREIPRLLSASNLIPGPTRPRWRSISLSTSGLARFGGGRGLLHYPAALIVTGFAWAYVRFGSLPRVGQVFTASSRSSSPSCCKRSGFSKVRGQDEFLGVVGAAAIMLTFLGVNELLVLFGRVQ